MSSIFILHKDVHDNLTQIFFIIEIQVSPNRGPRGTSLLSRLAVGMVPSNRNCKRGAQI